MSPKIADMSRANGSFLDKKGDVAYLPMVSRGLAENFREQLRIELSVHEALAAVAGGATSEARPKYVVETRQADQAVAGAAQREVADRAVGAVLALRRLGQLGRKLGGAQDGGHEQRAVLARAVGATSRSHGPRRCWGAMARTEGRGLLGVVGIVVEVV